MLIAGHTIKMWLSVKTLLDAHSSCATTIYNNKKYRMNSMRHINIIMNSIFVSIPVISIKQIFAKLISFKFPHASLLTSFRSIWFGSCSVDIILFLFYFFISCNFFFFTLCGQFYSILFVWTVSFWVFIHVDRYMICFVQAQLWCLVMREMRLRQCSNTQYNK